MLSHQLKRHNSASEESSDLTHIQRHILNYIYLNRWAETCIRRILEEAFHIRKSNRDRDPPADGEKRLYQAGECGERHARLKRIVPTPKAEKRREKIMENIRATERRLEMGISKDGSGNL